MLKWIIARLPKFIFSAILDELSRHLDPLGLLKIPSTNIPDELLCKLEKLDDTTQLGLSALLCVAVREGTNLSHQAKEWGMEDIPQDLIKEIDDMGDGEYLEVCLLSIQTLEAISTL